jgi:hypothetical protein
MQQVTARIRTQAGTPQGNFKIRPAIRIIYRASLATFFSPEE